MTACPKKPDLAVLPEETDPAVIVLDEVASSLVAAVVTSRDHDLGRNRRVRFRLGQLEHAVLATRRTPSTPGQTIFLKLHDCFLLWGAIFAPARLSIASCRGKNYKTFV